MKKPPIISNKKITEAINKVYPSGTGTYQVNPADKAIAQTQRDEDVKWFAAHPPHPKLK